MKNHILDQKVTVRMIDAYTGGNQFQEMTIGQALLSPAKIQEFQMIVLLGRVCLELSEKVSHLETQVAALERGA